MDFSSDTLLLSTKLKIPAPRKNYVMRRALFEKLSQCADLSVVFVRGGAGTGKTTLLSSFIREKEMKNVCWLSLDSSNVNVYSFWLYFAAAVSAFRDDGGSFLAMMRSNPDPSSIENLLIILINRLCGEEDYYMVLDDAHYIADAALIKSLEFFLNAMPSNFHLFMLSREDPPVYLGPLAMSGRLMFIDGKQMLLSDEEGLAFLKNTLGFCGSEEETERLNSYAEGWIGGLQLVAALGASGRNSDRLLHSGGGIAIEYLTREVLESLSQAERDFLTGTGFLAYFDADICNAVFDGLSRSDFDSMINSMIQKNLFVICLDEQNGVYRYHNILSDYLTQQLSLLPAAEQRNLHIKAAKAYEKRADYVETLREYLSANDFEEIIRVASMMDGRIEAWSYLDKVPVEKLVQNVDLAAQCFLYNLGILNIERCRILYYELKELYGDKDFFSVMQFAEPYFAANSASLPKYSALTTEQIENLGLGPAMKAMIFVQNTAALVERSKYDEAEYCIKRAIEICGGTNLYVDFFAYNQLAQIYEETGRLNDSLTSYTKAMELLRSLPAMTGLESNFYFGITGVYMRRMELDKAEAALENARLLLEGQHLHIDVANLTLDYHLAEMKFLNGDNSAGEAFVQRILLEYPSYSALTLGRLVHELECAGMLRKELADRFVREVEAEERYGKQPFMRLLRARLLFRRGEIREALKETEEVLIFSRINKNKLRLVEAGILKIILLQSSSERPEGKREIFNLLREAVNYAHEDLILMPFYLDRSYLLPLLKELLAQSAGKAVFTAAETAFVRSAVSVCSDSGGTVKEQDILSSRELEVLNELAQGITNREIAEKLCISQATVKTHVISIFGKLGVSSRMAAVDIGRSEGLIK